MSHAPSLPAADAPLGSNILHDPLRNKGSAFTAAERQLLGLEGVLPARYNDQSQQAERAWNTIRSLDDPLAKYRELSGLQDRNEYLYYRVLLDHLQDLMPIVYTPTVGLATQHFSTVFQRGRGLWITPEHKGRVRELMTHAVGHRPIKLLVVTDNESILGIGDQGAGGMAISIGKLSLYTAAAGIAPESTLPVSLDVGTNNKALLEDPNYLGWQQPRLRGAEFDALVEEFVAAVQSLFPDALLQWEDFRKSNALSIMNKYRHSVLSFNDDIQGTGAVTLAGVMSAMRATHSSLAKQRIVIHGAGAAGLGISGQIKAALSADGVADNAMHEHLAVLDSGGLLVDDRNYEDHYKADLSWPTAAAQALGLGPAEDRDLDAVVARYQPSVLIGTSGQAGAFGKDIVQKMLQGCEQPIIMPLSNPTANAEATPEDLLAWTEGQAVVATGSPFAPVERNGKTRHIGQGNNVFIFPGLGLGSLVVGATRISNAMITAAARALAETVTEAELDSGLLYPQVDRLRSVTAAVATAVALQAQSDGLAADTDSTDLHERIESAMWQPEYPSYT
ncbi:MAG: NAD-dependent malic enzyme [Pseudomonadales bacterium]